MVHWKRVHCSGAAKSEFLKKRNSMFNNSNKKNCTTAVMHARFDSWDGVVEYKLPVN